MRSRAVLASALQGERVGTAAIMARANKPHSSEVDASRAAGPLALPWRRAANAADGAYITGMTNKPVQIKGQRSELVCPHACCNLEIDGPRVSYSGRGKRLSLQTEDLLGAKVCTRSTARYDLS